MRAAYSSHRRVPPLVLLFLRPVSASWHAAPLRSFAGGAGHASSDGTGGGIRRFSHREEHALEGGGALSLQWDVDANADELLSVDAEHHHGVRVLGCDSDSIRVHLPAEYASRAASYRHIVASDALHGCEGSRGEHLYRRVHRVHSFEPRPYAATVATLVTEDLASPSQIFPYAAFTFRYAPAEALNTSLSRHPQPRRLRKGLNAPDSGGQAGSGGMSGSLFDSTMAPDASGDALGYIAAQPVSDQPGHSVRMDISEDFQKDGYAPGGDYGPNGNGFAASQSLLNFFPQEVSNFGWNWDYETNSTKNQRYKMEFPGGEGYALFEKPCVRAHAVLTIHFTSQVKAVGVPPHVKIVASLDGHGFISGDFTGILDADDAYSEKLWRQFHVHLPVGALGGTTYMNPLEFYLGSVPIRFAPGVRLGVNAYHLGRFRGSMRVGLATHVKFRAQLDFDTMTGLKTNFTTDLIDLKLKPPTWLIWTKRFQMCAMLEPQFWIRGSFGDVKNMQLDLDLRPYMNISISQMGPGNREIGRLHHLAVYPFRAIGLPTGAEFSVRIKANGKEVTTSSQLSSGAMEFSDDVQNFDFGALSEDDLLSNDIKVSLLRRDEVVASTSIYCTALVNGECKPAPSQAKLQLDGMTVVVQLSILWQAEPLTVLVAKTKSLSFRFPSITVSPVVAGAWHLLGSSAVSGESDAIAERSNASSVEFRMLRNGRTFSAPMKVNASHPEHVVLDSGVTYELGRCFLDSWRMHRPSAGDDPSYVQLMVPRLQLLVDGRVVGASDMPALPWDQAGTVFHQASHWRVFEGVVGTSHLGDIPVDFALRSEDDGVVVGTGKLHVLVGDSSRASFWIHPSEAKWNGHGSDGKTQLAWTVDAPQNEEVDFTLWAMHVKDDGSFKPMYMEKEFSQVCSTLEYGVADVKAYHSLRHTCAYNITLEDSRLAGLRIVFLMQWTRGGQMHEMVSPPIDFQAETTKKQQESRLQLGGPRVPAASAEMVPTRTAVSPFENEATRRQLRGVHIEGTDIDFDEKMREMNPTCMEEPLEYSVGFGVYARERIHHVRLPGSLAEVIGGASERPDYETGWLPFQTNEISDQISHSLSASVCREGICKGELPGCPPQDSPAFGRIEIPHLHFKLSRAIPWEDTATTEVRSIIAYGLSVLPEAIEIAKMDVNRAWRHWSSASSTEPAGSHAGPMASRAKTSTTETTTSTTRPSPSTPSASTTTTTLSDLDCSHVPCALIVCLDGSKPPVPPGECCGNQHLCPRVRREDKNEKKPAGKDEEKHREKHKDKHEKHRDEQEREHNDEHEEEHDDKHEKKQKYKHGEVHVDEHEEEHDDKHAKNNTDRHEKALKDTPEDEHKDELEKKQKDKHKEKHDEKPKHKDEHEKKHKDKHVEKHDEKAEENDEEKHAKGKPPEGNHAALKQHEASKKEDTSKADEVQEKLDGAANFTDSKEDTSDKSTSDEVPAQYQDFQSMLTKAEAASTHVGGASSKVTFGDVEDTTNEVEASQVEATLAKARQRIKQWERNIQGGPDPSTSTDVDAGKHRSRRLHASEGVESDEFVVRVVTPLPYKVDDQLVRALLARDAWRGISDGREAELGPVTITSATVHPPAEDAPDSSAQQPMSMWALAWGATVLVAAVGATAVLLLWGGIPTSWVHGKYVRVSPSADVLVEAEVVA